MSDTNVLSGYEYLNPATLHVFRAALDRKAITTTEVAMLIPKGLTGSPKSLRETITRIHEALVAHGVLLVSDKGLREHLKLHPTPPRHAPDRVFHSNPDTNHRTLSDSQVVDSPPRSIDTDDDETETSRDLLVMYKRDMRRYKILSLEEEQALGVRILEGDATARDTLVCHNLRLVPWFAQKYSWSPLPFEDLIQEGNLGLLTAANKFDHRNGRFTTYAIWWIRQRITRAIANTGDVIRIPVHMHEVCNKIRSARRKLEVELGREPTATEIEKHTDIPVKLVRKAEALLHEIEKLISLDEPVTGSKGDGEGPTPGELVVDTGSVGPELYLEALEELARAENRLRTILAQLTTQIDTPKRNRDIFMSLYGIEDGCVRKTLQSTSDEFKITKERVRQIIATIWEGIDALGGDMDHSGFVAELHRIESLQKIVLSVRDNAVVRK